MAYISALAKKSLPLVQRRPYYHFLLDVSAAQTWQKQTYQSRVARQLKQAMPNNAAPRFSLVNAYTHPLSATGDWAKQLSEAEGGFYLGGAIRRVLFDARQHLTPTYPVIVVVTDHLGNAVLDHDFEDFSSAYPESDSFYVLGPDGTLVPHSLRHNSRQPLAESTVVPKTAVAVRAWPTAAHPLAYLPDNELADVVLAQPQAVPAPNMAPASRWLAGLVLRGYEQWQSFHPETTDRERVPFMQASFRAGIMTQFTSFLALENDAQKASLRRKQEQVLAANASLDTMEDEDTPADAPSVNTPIDGGAGLLLVAGVLLAGWQLRCSRPALS